MARHSERLELRPSFSARPRISHVVFDFDGTLSWLRHGWPEIMVCLFREYVPVQAGESESTLHDLLLKDILSLNGKSSIYQMRLCAERARERGSQSPRPEELLVEYGRRLDVAIRTRSGKILRGEMERDDFVVYGARPFLERLRELGLTLVILSGTAEPRVKQEAELLGLAKYFGEHIYGGTADLAQSSKRAVISRLLDQENFSGEHLLAFGDGPVEIQLAKEAGGLAVGVASDEDHNGSGRMDAQKITQLRDAGADALIPDYRDANVLLEFILGRECPGNSTNLK